MKRKLLFLIFLFPSFIFAQYTTDDVYNYIDKYHRIATEMMKETGIPASIKLAQSIYSSGAGTAPLVKITNNYFGILCGTDWTGDSYTDSTHQTCYRKYKTIKESWEDHTLFLKGRSRYNKLFFLDMLDYKAWANALQESGYSMNPKYAQNIIEIIETYYLHIYDKEGRSSEYVKPSSPPVTSPVNQHDEEKAREEEKARIEKLWKEFEITERARMQKEKDDFEAKIVKDRKAFEEKQRIQHEVRRKIFADSLKIEILVEKPALPKAETTPAVRKDTIMESGIEVIINKPVKNPEKTKSEEAGHIEPAKTPVLKETSKTENFQKQQNDEKMEILVFKAKDFEYKPAYYAFTNRNVYENNKVKFVIAQRDDTYAKIAKDVQLAENKVREYNDLFDNTTYEPAVGEVVYISPKNSKSIVQTHIVRKGETMRYIAQKYAVPLKVIYKKNGYSTDAFTEGKTICITCK
jgi:LysM repeat protein